jgi:alkanesulfonate monooxygenase SsuD/methylene tetrahydromethanopterin reductase-like flavin-dependent oxidoreductase (luciferase family)
VPAPLTRPRPPILIGGGGLRKTLLLVARYADACNLFASSPEEVAPNLDALRSHCEAEGRDYDAISKTVLYEGPVLDRNPDEFVADVQCYAALGVSQLGVMPDRDPGGIHRARRRDCAQAGRPLTAMEHWPSFHGTHRRLPIHRGSG